MSSLHNALQKYGILLTAYADALGESSSDKPLIERLGETLTPIIDIWSRDEWAALFGEALWWRSQFQAAVAANNSFAGVTNVTADKIVTVEGWAVDSAAIGVGSLVPAVVAPTIVAAPGGNASGRDLRYGGFAAIAAVRGFAGSEAAATLTNNWNRELANTMVPIKVVLPPGQNLAFENATVNAQLTINAFGRVRPAFPGELGPVTPI